MAISEVLRASLAEVTRAKIKRSDLGNLSKSIEATAIDLAQCLAKIGFTLSITRTKQDDGHP